MSEVKTDALTRTSIHIGGIWASREPSIVRTVLGSCIAVCLHDPYTRIGGMNHFMLPDCPLGEVGTSRYGVHAMELLINACMKLGADRRRLEAKVFGGGHVLKTREHESSVPRRNLDFTFEFLMTENIPVIAKDTGGLVARSVHYFTDSGKILLKRLRETGCESDELAEITYRERKARSEARKSTNLTLF